SSFATTATSDVYTLSLHDALPIYARHRSCHLRSRSLVADLMRRSAQPAKMANPGKMDNPGKMANPQAVDNPETVARPATVPRPQDRKSTRLNSSHVKISYAVFCLK